MMFGVDSNTAEHHRSLTTMGSTHMWATEHRCRLKTSKGPASQLVLSREAFTPWAHEFISFFTWGTDQNKRLPALSPLFALQWGHLLFGDLTMTLYCIPVSLSLFLYTESEDNAWKKYHMEPWQPHYSFAMVKGIRKIKFPGKTKEDLWLRHVHLLVPDIPLHSCLALS